MFVLRCLYYATLNTWKRNGAENSLVDPQHSYPKGWIMDHSDNELCNSFILSLVTHLHWDEFIYAYLELF